MLVKAEVMNVVASQLGKLVQPGVKVTPQSSITGDLGLDSITVMNFVMWLEDAFDVSIPLDRLVDTETVGDLVSLLESLCAKKANEHS